MQTRSCLEMLEDARRQTQRVGQRNTKTAEDTQEDAQRSHLKRHSSGRSPRFILRFTTWFFQRKSSFQAPCKLLASSLQKLNIFFAIPNTFFIRHLNRNFRGGLASGRFRVHMSDLGATAEA